jgi:hypothetical protein
VAGGGGGVFGEKQMVVPTSRGKETRIRYTHGNAMQGQ